MIHFVVVAGTPAAVARVSPRLTPALEKTRYFDGMSSTTTGANGTWSASAIAVSDPMCDSRLAFDDDALAVMNGPALRTDGAASELIDDLLTRFKTRGSIAVAEALGGSYNFVGIAPSSGLRAFVDFSGTFPLYWHAGRDVAIFSNRSTTVAATIDSTEWDLRALGWLISQANLRGERLPSLGVSYLLPGIEAQMRTGAGDIRFESSPTWVWPLPSEHPPRENLTPAEWDDVTADLIANVRSLATRGQRMRLLLSGGKDSRLCLALAKAAGLEDRIVTVTNGPAGGPEVECATEVARVAGFSHVRVGGDYDARPNHPRRRPSWPTLRSVASRRAREAPASFDAEHVWRRLRQHVYRYEAIVSPWDGITDPLRHVTLNIRGVGGELYRRGNDKGFRRMNLRSSDEMVPVITKTSDPLGVLDAGERAFQDDWVQEWARGSAQRVRLDALPEKWYTDYRLGHWNGPLSQAKPGYIIVSPIVSDRAAAKNLELSADARSSDRLHFEVMCRVAPDLVYVPFMNDTWSPQVAAGTPMDLPRSAFPTTVEPTHRALASWQYLFLEHQRREIERLLDDAARDTDMGSICDLERLKKRLHTAKSVGRGPMQVISCIGVALALLGRAERVVDHCPPQPAPGA